MPINVDITKAKVITKDRLRADRTPLLAAQDILFMRHRKLALLQQILLQKSRGLET